MTLVRAVVQDAAIGVGVADTPEGLSVVRRPGCAAAIWRRQSLPVFQSWIDGLDPAQLPSARVTLRPAAVRDAAAQICDASGTPACAERDRLIDDVAALADIFAGLTRATWLCLRFDVVTNNACRKFHIDTVTAPRLHLSRHRHAIRHLDRRGRAEARLHRAHRRTDPAARHALAGAPEVGPAHRSPPIEGTGETRLVLVLDPQDGT